MVIVGPNTEGAPHLLRVQLVHDHLHGSLELMRRRERIIHIHAEIVENADAPFIHERGVIHALLLPLLTDVLLGARVVIFCRICRTLLRLIRQLGVHGFGRGISPGQRRHIHDIGSRDIVGSVYMGRRRGEACHTCIFLRRT